MTSGHSTRPYYMVYVALMLLLALTVFVASFDIGGHAVAQTASGASAERLPSPSVWNFAIAMIIATTKAGLILWIFMHLHESSSLTWLFAASALVWLAILAGLTLNDYVFR